MTMARYPVIFHTTARGRSPAVDFIKGLDKKAQAAVLRKIERLETEGPMLGPPDTHDVRTVKGLRELRIANSGNQYRIFYVHEAGAFVLLCGFTKKSQKLPVREIERAARLLAEARRKTNS